MRYILISKSKTYGDLYFDKISKNIFQLDCKLSRKNTNISDNSRALPPYFFMLSLYSILIIFVFISTLSKITTSFYFPFVLLSGLPYLIAYIINLRSTDKKIKKAAVIDIGHLDDFERTKLLDEIAQSINLLYSSVRDRTLTGCVVVILIVLIPSFFYGYPMSVFLRSVGCLIMEYFLYIILFSCKKRRKKIYNAVVSRFLTELK